MIKFASLFIVVCCSFVLMAEEKEPETPKADPVLKEKETAPALAGTTIDGPFDLKAFQKKHPGKHIVVAFSRASW